MMFAAECSTSAPITARREGPEKSPGRRLRGPRLNVSIARSEIKERARYGDRRQPELTKDTICLSALCRRDTERLFYLLLKDIETITWRSGTGRTEHEGLDLHKRMLFRIHD